jgi:hypothetical protein
MDGWAAARRGAATRIRDLDRLLERRPDLAGVYLPAHITVAAVRWAA